MHVCLSTRPSHYQSIYLPFCLKIINAHLSKLKLTRHSVPNQMLFIIIYFFKLTKNELIKTIKYLLAFGQNLSE